jgi:hypothetical protein
MGVLVEGKWQDGQLPQETGASGEFRRADSSFRDRITADGSSGFKAEPGRYHLYVAHGCPWAHRTLIYRSLKKLNDAITVAYALPGLRQQGWTYEHNPAFPDCTPDTVNGFRHLHQAYTATDARYTGKVTVPTLWDKKTGRIVNNESSEIIRMLNSEFNGIAGDDADFYPKPLRAEIDRRSSMPTSTTASIAAASPSHKPLTRRPTTHCSRRWTKSMPGLRASVISLAARSPKPIGGCFPPWCASTSPTSRCFAATSSASPTIPILRITCASFISCPASPRR